MSQMPHDISQKVTIDLEFQSLIPPLSDEELQQLEANLIAEGCRDPLVVWGDDGTLLDGHNRYRICQKHALPFKTINLYGTITSREDAKVWIIRNQFGRRNLPTYERGRLALTLESIFQEKAKANQGTRTDFYQNSDRSLEPVITAREVAKIAGISHDTIARIKAIEERAPEDLREQARQQKISVNEAYQTLRKGERRAERIEKIQELAVASIQPLTGIGMYPVILADPPWRYDFAADDADVIENHYPTMTLDEICALPVSDVALEDCVMFLWTTSPKLEESFQVLKAWGFTYRTCAVWDKQWIGPGYYFRQRHELLLVATKGSLPVPSPSNRPDSVFTEKRTAHSRKPEVAYRLIESMYPELPKLELFSRESREGWQSWGNEATQGVA